jgi:hypothetical protein
MRGLPRLPSHNWLGRPATALGAVIVVAVWKEAGFFMIFYLAALQQMNPSLREAAAIEGASRWYFFCRVQWPLLMPTTLFVLVNAVINAFRMVDHIVVMTRGGPDNATTLLLYHLYEVGFKFWDTGLRRRADHGAAGPAGDGGAAPVLRARPQGALQMSARPTHPRPWRPIYNEPAWLDTHAEHGRAGRWRCCGCCRWCYAVWTAFHPSEYSTPLRPLRAADAGQLRAAWAAAPFARYFLNTSMLVTMILAGQLCWARWPPMPSRASSSRGKRRAVRAGAGAADDHARRAAGGKLPHHGALGLVDTLLGDRRCPTSRRPSASSCCARPSRASRASWTRPRASRAPARCRSCGASTCRWPGRCTSPSRWCR